MTISKKQLEEAREAAYKFGHYRGVEQGKEEAKKEFSDTKAHAQTAILAAAAELAQANAKLTYAMSRMVAEKGW